MNDTYIELLVKKPDSKAATLLHNIMIGVGAVLFLGALFYDVIFVVASIVVLVCSVIPTLKNDVEYEYLYLDRELTIDQIRKQEKRKNVAAYSMDRLVLMAPKGASELQRFQQLKAIDYSSGTEEGNPYEIVVDGNGKKVRIIIDTTKELVEAIRRINPGNVK